MSKKEYLIGDVAAMIGVSRDTLRFYEKKGIISAHKKENGYRYYSEDDIFELSSIFYHRKMNIGLDEIENLWNGDNSFKTASQIAKQQIEAEKAEILKHQQALTRLHLFQEECRKIEKSQNKISVKTFPRSYIVETCATPQEGVIAWFYQSQKKQGLDMMYTYDAYSYDPLSPKAPLQFLHSSLLMYEDLTDSLDSSFCPDSYPKAECPECLYTIVESPERIPDQEIISDMIAWGREQQIEAGDLILSDYIMHGIQDGAFTFYLEIYIPIQKKAEALSK